MNCSIAKAILYFGIPAALAAFGWTASLGQAGSSFPLDVDSEEISLSEATRTAPGPVHASASYGDGADTLVTLMLRRSAIRQRRSSDGGTSFDSERVVAGESLGGLAILSAEGALASDNELYLALLVADPGGDVGLQLIHSSDFGNTWSAPVDLVRRPQGDDGVFSVGIGAASGGRVTVAWVDRWDGHIYARSSTDGAASFGSAQRVDAIGGVATLTTPPRIRIGADGTIHAVFAVESLLGDNEVRYARSTDSGQTYSPDTGFPSCVGGSLLGTDPALELSSSGSVLVAFIKQEATEIHRSADNGATFSCVANIPPATAEESPHFVDLAPSPATNTVLAALVEADVAFDAKALALRIVQSVDDGASFGTPVAVSPSVMNIGRGGRMEGSVDEAFVGLSRLAPRVVQSDAGTWVAAWNDTRDTVAPNDLLAPWDTYLASSVDDGANWSAATRAALVNTPSDFSSLASLSTIAPDDIVTTWLDDRADGHNASELYLGRSAASALSFGSESRVDTPLTGLDPVPCYGSDVAMASIAPDRVFTVYSCPTRGEFSRIFVATSADRGESYTAQQVSRPPSASSNGFDLTPRLAAASDGAVYAAYLSLRSDGGSEIRVNRSLDSGDNWLADDVVVETDAVADGQPLVLSDMVAAPGGLVMIAFTNPEGSTSFLARSVDSAATFAITDLDPIGIGDSAVSPRLCLSGSSVFAVYLYNDALLGADLRAKISTDSGQSFGGSTPLTGSEIFDGSSHRVACNANGNAVVAWSGFSLTGFSDEGFARQYTAASAWAGQQTIGAVAGGNLRVIDASFVDAATALVTMRAELTAGVPGQVFGDQQAHLARSIDEGASFAPLVRLDTASPVAGRVVYGPKIASQPDGAVWVAWEDLSVGAGAVIVRRSSDGGASFGPVKRMHKEPAQGSRSHRFGSGSDIVVLPGASLPGRGFFGWGGDRSASVPEVVVGCDGCTGASTTIGPGLVSALELTRIALGTLRLSWNPDCGVGTKYGIYRGDLDLGYSSAVPDPGACSVTATTHDLPEGAERGEFFLIVPNDGSGDGSYGAQGDGTPRDAPSGVCFPQGLVDSCAP